MATIVHRGRLFGSRAFIPANRRYTRVVARERADTGVGARDILGAFAFAAASFGVLAALGAPLVIAAITAVIVGALMAFTPRYEALVETPKGQTRA
jgi:hypothetical protein